MNDVGRLTRQRSQCGYCLSTRGGRRHHHMFENKSVRGRSLLCETCAAIRQCLLLVSKPLNVNKRDKHCPSRILRFQPFLPVIMTRELSITQQHQLRPFTNRSRSAPPLNSNAFSVSYRQIDSSATCSMVPNKRCCDFLRPCVARPVCAAILDL